MRFIDFRIMYTRGPDHAVGDKDWYCSLETSRFRLGDVCEMGETGSKMTRRGPPSHLGDTSFGLLSLASWLLFDLWYIHVYTS